LQRVQLEMNVAILIGAVVLAGMCLGWFFHRRSVHQITPILRQLAAEENGVVVPQGPFVMPKLVFPYSGTTVEVSCASTGSQGESIRYTYVVFNDLALKDFEFRILPRSLQTLTDEWAGFKKPLVSEIARLKDRLSIYTNNDRLMESVLTESIQTDLLFWAEGEGSNRISDIRNYDNKLIYAVTGTLKNHKEFKLLISNACTFFDAVKNKEADDA
jgi:hypothetical protein